MKAEQRSAVVNGKGYLALLTVLGAQRLIEVRWSARNVKRSAPGQIASSNTFPLMVLANAGLFVIPALTRTGRPRPRRSVRTVAGIGLVTAVGLRIWSIATLGGAWNVRALVSNELEPIRTGPYRWVRHPNYVAVALEFAAAPLLGGGYAEAVALSGANAAVLRPRIRAEEALLDAVPGYREAFAHTPRFIPRFITGRRFTRSAAALPRWLLAGGRWPSVRPRQPDEGGGVPHR